MNDTRCLVLGGRGFIGSHLVDALLAQGFRVRCFDRPRAELLGESHLSNPNFELLEGDISSQQDLTDAVQDCELCFHLISTTLPNSSNLDPVFDVQSNLIGTLQIIGQGMKSRLRKIVFVSSGGTVYGNPLEIPIPESHPTDPTCSYGITKLAIEKYLALYHLLHGLDYTVLRIANPFGDRQRLNANQGAVAVFFGKVLRGEPVDIWGDGSVVRDYIYIADVIDALLAAARYQGSKRVFNIGSGEGHSLNQVLEMIEQVTGRRAHRRYMTARTFDVPISVLNIQRATQLLGWQPRTGFVEGLTRFNTWIQAQPPHPRALNGAADR